MRTQESNAQMGLVELRNVVEDHRTPAGRAFAISVQFLIVVSLISFAIETLPDLSQSTRRVLWWVEAVTVVLFSVEYVIRVVVAERKTDYVFSFFGIIDLVAILPFYIASGIDLRAIRTFRLLRRCLSCHDWWTDFYFSGIDDWAWHRSGACRDCDFGAQSSPRDRGATASGLGQQ